MDVIRRNTDYALRAMVHLAQNGQQGAISAKQIAAEQGFSPALASKLMQRLQKAGLVISVMGVRGGFQLGRAPKDISLQEIIETIQGPISLSRCVLGVETCCKHASCPIRKKLGRLQTDIVSYLGDTTLDELVSVKTEH
ncbi:RrF2 family transcriptional regulator [Planctomycetota bacterium]